MNEREENDRKWLAWAFGDFVPTDDEIVEMVNDAALRGFDPVNLTGSLSQEVRHFEKHVRRNQEWPDGTSLAQYVESARDSICHADAIYAHTHHGNWAIGFARQSGELQGPGGGEWIVVQYKLEIGRWVTVYQTANLLNSIMANPAVRNVRWLRQHASILQEN